MKVFRGLCLAAAMGLLVTCAFPQGRGHDSDKDKGGQSSGGSSQGRGDSGRGSGGSGGGSTQNRGDGGRSGGSGGGGGYGGPSRGSGGGGGGGTQGRGDSGRGSGGGYGGPSRGSGGSGGSSGGGGTQGRGDGGRGTGGGGGYGGPSRGSGGSGGGSTQGRGDGGRGNGSGGTGGGQIGGGGGSQGRGDGDLGRGHGNSGGGSSGTGNRGGGSGSSGGSGNSGGQGTRGNGGNIGGGGNGGWNQDPLGRPTRGSNDQLGRGGNRGGTVHYGGNSNVASVTKIGGTIVIGRAPKTISDITRRDQIRRKDHPSLIYGGYRVGYYYYNTSWCDDNFWFGFYCFDPWADRCCVSPWYYYSMLPPYVAWNRCRFYNMRAWDAWVGDPYQWQRPVYYGNYDNWGRGRSSEIDYAVDDIANAFERADRRAAGRLISSSSDVAIYVDGKYSYTLNADDFYDMFLDATQNTKTKRYQILHVETGRDEGNRDCVRVTARHEYEDAWGATTSVTHFYELHYEGSNLVIDKFGVSQ